MRAGCLPRSTNAARTTNVTNSSTDAEQADGRGAALELLGDRVGVNLLLAQDVPERERHGETH
jgi:hypothetical protein